MDINEIFTYLPHRYPFLLVDRVLTCTVGESITGMKNVTINEPFFQGHFPGHPVMPGLLIVEAMAQLAGILAFRTHDKTPQDGSIYYLAGTDKARFKRPVVPGDQLVMSASILTSRARLMKFDCKAEVDGQLACAAELMCVEKDLTA